MTEPQSSRTYRSCKDNTHTMVACSSFGSNCYLGAAFSARYQRRNTDERSEATKRSTARFRPQFAVTWGGRKGWTNQVFSVEKTRKWSKSNRNKYTRTQLQSQFTDHRYCCKCLPGRWPTPMLQVSKPDLPRRALLGLWFLSLGTFRQMPLKHDSAELIRTASFPALWH